MERLLCGLLDVFRKSNESNDSNAPNACAAPLRVSAPAPVPDERGFVGVSADRCLNSHTYDNTPAFTLEGVQTVARVVDVYDADTMTVILPFGGRMYRFSIRLAGIDSCEIKSKQDDLKRRAIAARNRVLQLLGINVGLDDNLSRKEVRSMLTTTVATVWIVCGCFDKYGRVLANVFQHAGTRTSISGLLLREGHAYAYAGGTKRSEEEQASAF
jgi:endonuclease YncB( thermonuclease family)